MDNGHTAKTEARPALSYYLSSTKPVKKMLSDPSNVSAIDAVCCLACDLTIPCFIKPEKR